MDDNCILTLCLVLFYTCLLISQLFIFFFFSFLFLYYLLWLVVCLCSWMMCVCMGGVCVSVSFTVFILCVYYLHTHQIICVKTTRNWLCCSHSLSLFAIQFAYVCVRVSVYVGSGVLRGLTPCTKTPTTNFSPSDLRRRQTDESCIIINTLTTTTTTTTTILMSTSTTPTLYNYHYYCSLSTTLFRRCS